MSKKSAFLLIIIVSVTFVSFKAIRDKPLLTDEKNYFKLILDVSRFHFSSSLFAEGTLPGYSISVGLLESLFKTPSIPSTRLITTFFSLLSILVFYLISSRIDPGASKLKTLQYFFFPILFPFFFLIYTDVYSLLFVLFTFLLIVEQRYYWAGFVGLLSLFIRQSNLVWLGFFCLYIYFNKYTLSSFCIKDLVRYLKDITIFLFSLVISIIFLFKNKGAVIADYSKQTHPLSFHLENVFFLLFLFFFFFLPLNIANFPKIIRLPKTKLHYVMLTLLIVNIYFIFLLTFKIDHPFNFHSYFLRNNILNYFTGNFIMKSIFFLAAAYSVLSLVVTPLFDKKYYLIYPTAFLVLSLSWLIEQRYYLIPFILFILYKKTESLLVEILTLSNFIILTGIIFFIILNGRFFI